jgi:hypothetical protein
VLPAAAAFGRAARRLALVAAVSAAVLTYALFRDGLPEPTSRAVVTVLLAVLLFVPAAVLTAFWRACVEVVELPDRLRALPGAAAGHAADLGQLLRERHTARARAWRLLVLTRSSRELLTPYAPLVALLSPPFLGATAIAVLATAVEATAALVVIVVLAAAA